MLRRRGEGEHRKMIMLDIYEVAKLFVAWGATATHHKQNCLWKYFLSSKKNEFFNLQTSIAWALLFGPGKTLCLNKSGILF